MRRFWILAGLLAISCSLAGCDDGSSSKPASPEEAKAGLDIVKKANPGPLGKGGPSGSSAPKK